MFTRQRQGSRRRVWLAMPVIFGVFGVALVLILSLFVEQPVWAGGTQGPLDTPTATYTDISTATHPPTCTDTTTPTRTRTLTPTPTSTPTSCGPVGYVISQGTGPIVSGTVDTGNHCDDCTTNIALPFTFYLYEEPFTAANVDSNGTMAFTSNSSAYSNSCLPTANYYNAIFPLWDDLMTSTGLSGCSNYSSGCGIFTTVEGTAPNRIFDIEWRAVYYDNNANTTNFEVRLYEIQSRFDVIYTTVTGWGGQHGSDQGATVGVQNGTGPQNTQFSCNTASLAPGMLLTFTYYVYCYPTGTPPPTYTPTITPTFTNTPTPTLTPTPGPCVQPIQEGFESGTLGLFTSSGSPGWSATTTASHTGIYSAFAPDVGYVSDQQLTMSNPVAVPLNATSATLSFWHRYDLEMAGGTAYDGGVLELSSDNGASWNDAQFISGGYNFTLVGDCSSQNLLAGRRAWSGSSNGTFVQATVDLMPYRGHSLLFRFRLGTDQTGSAAGWWIDDILVSFTQSFCFTATPTDTLTPTPTPSTLPSQTRTPTLTPMPALVGHVDWQGRPAQPNTLQELPITLTLKSGTTEVDYPTQLTDQYGFFTLTLNPLSAGTYIYRADDSASIQHSPNYLASSGTLTLTRAPVTNVEIGLMKAGDANNDDIVNVLDFSILRGTFGMHVGEQGYDDRADFNGDQVVNAQDFNLLRSNFGQGGAPPIGPGGP